MNKEKGMVIKLVTNGGGYGYGFIRTESGDTIFFHSRGVSRGAEFDDLREGTEVEYYREKEIGEAGREKAIAVTIV